MDYVIFILGLINLLSNMVFSLGVVLSGKKGKLKKYLIKKISCREIEDTLGMKNSDEIDLDKKIYVGVYKKDYIPCEVRNNEYKEKKYYCIYIGSKSSDTDYIIPLQELKYSKVVCNSLKVSNVTGGIFLILVLLLILGV